MGISERIRNIFNQNQGPNSPTTVEKQLPSFEQFEGLVKEELIKNQKRQIDGGNWSSKEAAIERLQQAQMIATASQSKEQNELTGKMTNYYKNNFYLSDYMHLWLNVDKQKNQLFQQQKRQSVEEGMDHLIFDKMIKSLEETMNVRKEIILICFSQPEYNRQLNDESRDEVVERTKASHFMIDPMIQASIEKIGEQERAKNGTHELMANLPKDKESGAENNRKEEEPELRAANQFKTVMEKNRKMTINEDLQKQREPATVGSKDDLNKKNTFESMVANVKQSANQKKTTPTTLKRKITIYQKRDILQNKKRRFIFIRRQLRKLLFRNRQKISLINQQIKMDKKARIKAKESFGYRR